MLLNFQLSEQEANQLLNILAEKPYIQVAVLINKIQSQVQQQIAQAQLDQQQQKEGGNNGTTPN